MKAQAFEKLCDLMFNCMIDMEGANCYKDFQALEKTRRNLYAKYRILKDCSDEQAASVVRELTNNDQPYGVPINLDKEVKAL